MVSIIDRKQGGFGDFVYTFTGLSTDIKPATTNGSSFFEMDTRKMYYYDADAETWILQEREPK